VDGDDTRLRLARRLSEIETAPDASDGNVMLIDGIESPMMFITSFRMIIHEDLSDVTPPVPAWYPQDTAVQNCLVSAYHARQVSHPCSLALDQFQKFKESNLLKHITIYHYVYVIIAMIPFMSLIVLVCCLSDTVEEDDEDSLGDEYVSMTESIKMNGAYTAVPLRVV